MTGRRSVAAAGVALAVLATSGHAAPPAPQIVDAKGDAIGMQPGTDIESVTFAATRTGKVVNGFTVTMKLGAPPVRQPGVLYRVYGTQSVCGDFKMSSAATAALIEQNQVTMTCGEPDPTTGDPYTIINVTPKTVGSSLVWSFKLKMLPKEMRSGTMSELEAFVTVADPVFGIFNTADFAPQSAIDHAVGTATFKY
ncbi:MAG TPA: hypothetical protein VNA14_03890 [Mycobacteriales bacterium]|nr:hypothetical protein [Mycobacteriales bacterium]